MIENAISWQNNGSDKILGDIILPTSLGTLNLQQSSLSPRALSIFQLPDFILSLEHAGIPALISSLNSYPVNTTLLPHMAKPYVKRRWIDSQAISSIY